MKYKIKQRHKFTVQKPIVQILTAKQTRYLIKASKSVFDPDGLGSICISMLYIPFQGVAKLVIRRKCTWLELVLEINRRYISFGIFDIEEYYLLEFIRQPNGDIRVMRSKERQQNSYESIMFSTPRYSIGILMWWPYLLSRYRLDRDALIEIKKI